MFLCLYAHTAMPAFINPDDEEMRGGKLGSSPFV